MDALKRYKYHGMAAVALLGLLLGGSRTKSGHATRNVEKLPKVANKGRFEQGKELLPQHKEEFTAVADVGGGVEIRDFIYSTVRKSLPRQQRVKAMEISRAVITEANRHHMDPLFLLAVIKTESKFDNDVRGTHGEVGLMQVMPSTAAWLAPKAGLKKKYDLKKPSINIRIGATYLSMLRNTFKRKGKRYVAAYNMGSNNVRKLLAAKVEPNDYPARVLSNYEQFYFSLGIAASAPQASVTRSFASLPN